MANRRIPSLAALRGFEAVARHSSFTAAAAELGVTQGAVSYQIKQLEAEFCTSLFHRKGRVITLTEPARRLLPVLQKSFRDIGTAVAELRSESAEPHLTVALSTYFAAHWLSRQLGRFCQQHPQIKLRLQHPEHSVNFGNSDVHMVILWHKADQLDRHEEEELLFTSDLSPVCSPRLQYAKQPIEAPMDLLRYTLLRDERTIEAWSEWFAAAGVKHLHPLNELTMNDPNVYIQAAIDGQGIALGDALISDDIALHRLIKPFSVALGGYGYFVTYPVGALKRPNVKAFRDWLVAETALER